MAYINHYSWRSFLSSQAKILNTSNDIFVWSIRNRIQLASARPLSPNDVPLLQKFLPFSFFYFTLDDIEILKQIPQTKITKRKDPDIYIPIKNISIAGNKNKSLRHAINRAKKYNLSVYDNFHSLDDIKQMLARWKETSGDKYFQARTGKNLFFFKNNLHADCLNSFFYSQNSLVGFSVLSPPAKDNTCSYILGKALCLDYFGLSEFVDLQSYLKAVKKYPNLNAVNLGGGGKSLKQYKLKFPGSIETISYDGKIQQNY